MTDESTKTLDDIPDYVREYLAAFRSGSITVRLSIVKQSDGRIDLMQIECSHDQRRDPSVN